MSQEYPSTSKFKIIRDFPNTGVRVNAGLAKPVPGPSRGMLFRTASILVVVVWDAEPKRDRKLSESCMLTSLSYFYDGPRRSLICVRKWKWPSTSERWKIWRKTSQLFPIRGFEQKSVIICFTIIPFYTKPNSYPKLIYYLFTYYLFTSCHRSLPTTFNRVADDVTHSRRFKQNQLRVSNKSAEKRRLFAHLSLS